MRQDPNFQRTGGAERGRDGCRVPMPWAGEQPPFDFSAVADTWLPMPAEWSGLSVERQETDPTSVLTLYRRAVAVRHARADFADLKVEFLDLGPDVMAFRGGDGMLCVVNTGTAAVPLPDGELLLASESTEHGLAAGAAAWLR
jgi:alpha-glucosidase